MKKQLDFAVSTLAFAGQPAEMIIDIAKSNDLALEFSSGLPYRDDMAQLYLQAPVTRYPHNYFPAPEQPFVLNLASGDQRILKRSVDHCLQGLELAKKSGAPFFSAHAGFCIDPDPAQLGKKLQVDSEFDRESHWRIFLDSLIVVTRRAHELGIMFLVENNVLASFNTRRDEKVALFCCDMDETCKLFETVGSPSLGLLLDTAHLKVSAQTLEFDEHEAVLRISEYVKCIHHSDNDGRSDNNMPLTPDYWFLHHMPAFTRVVHVLEVSRQQIKEIVKQKDLLEDAAFAIHGSA